MKYCLTCARDGLGFERLDQYRFCPLCGTTLSTTRPAIKCAACQHVTDQGNAYCPYCGVKQPKVTVVMPYHSHEQPTRPA